MDVRSDEQLRFPILLHLPPDSRPEMILRSRKLIFLHRPIRVFFTLTTRSSGGRPASIDRSRVMLRPYGCLSVYAAPAALVGRSLVLTGMLMARICLHRFESFVLCRCERR